MALLSSVFPAFKSSPEIHYAFLEDLREDDFIGGVEKICREVRELFPNTNLVALIREKSEEFRSQKMKAKVVQDQNKALEYEIPSYEEIEKNKKEWYELKKRLADEKGLPWQKPA